MPSEQGERKYREQGERKYRLSKRGRNKPPRGEPWVWQTYELMLSDAWQSLSINARKVIDRVLIEHMAHAGTENGALIVTHEDFARYGVTRRLITEAIDEAEFLGLLKTKRGGRWNQTNVASRFQITWLSDREGVPATNAWKRRKTEQINAWHEERRERKALARQWRQKRELAPRRGGSIPPEVGVRLTIPKLMP